MSRSSNAEPKVNDEPVIRTMSNDEALVRERRRFIAERALPLFMEKGYNRTSVREISKACDMSVGAVYHYLGSKDDIGLLVAEQLRTEMLEFMEHAFEDTRPEESLRSTIAGWCRLCDRLQDHVVFLYREPRNIRLPVQKRIVEIDRQCIEKFEDILRRGVDAGVFKIADVRLFALTICVLGNMWAFRRWYLKNLITLDQYIDCQTDAVLNSALGGR